MQLLIVDVSNSAIIITQLVIFMLVILSCVVGSLDI
jgi:hypothetical protein